VAERNSREAHLVKGALQMKKSYMGRGISSKAKAPMVQYGMGRGISEQAKSPKKDQSRLSNKDQSRLTPTEREHSKIGKKS